MNFQTRLMGSVSSGIRNYFFGITILFSFVSFLLNGWNRHVIRTEGNTTAANASLRGEWMILNADDEYYLSPAQNLLASGELRRSPAAGNGSYFRRVPVYPLMLSAFLAVFGQQTPLFLHLFQCLLFGISVGLLFLILCRWDLPLRWSFTAAALYGLWPYTAFWSAFTLTEAVTPVLTMAYLWFLQSISSHPSRRGNWTWAGAILSLLVYTRPYMILAALPLLILLFTSRAQFLRLLPAALLFPVIVSGSWLFRNKIQTGEWVLFEQAFHPQSLDRMKPEFRGMFTLAKAWGVTGREFNAMHQPFYIATVDADTTYDFPGELIRHIPKDVFTADSAGLLNAFRAHRNALREQAPYYHALHAMPDVYMASSIEAEAAYRKAVRTLRNRSAWKYSIKPRLMYLQRLIFHSGSAHVFALQKDGIVSSGWKAIFFAVHASCFLLLIPLCFLLHRYSRIPGMMLSVLLAAVFFSCIHLEIEQRYMLPFMPLLYAGCVLGMYVAGNNFFSRHRKESDAQLFP
ncbi:MAG: glycosyltransferase family 39 protein [Bacteroidia bacterium]|nr:glycosyltransferase family 39 protein [Bacteroidia bacterium]